MVNTKFEDLVQVSIQSLIKAGAIKSVSFDGVIKNNRYTVRLEGQNFTFAEIMMGKESDELIVTKELSNDVINQSLIIVSKGGVNSGSLRFVMKGYYTDLGNIFDDVKDAKTMKLEKKNLKIIINTLDDYWIKN